MMTVCVTICLFRRRAGDKQRDGGQAAESQGSNPSQSGAGSGQGSNSNTMDTGSLPVSKENSKSPTVQPAVNTQTQPSKSESEERGANNVNS